MPRFDQIVTTSAGKKDDLPWLKLAKFGDEKSADKSLRHDANVNLITGIELDYDKKEMAFDEAVRVIEAARLYALLYTTPSHTNEVRQAPPRIRRSIADPPLICKLDSRAARLVYPCSRPGVAPAAARAGHRSGVTVQPALGLLSEPR